MSRISALGVGLKSVYCHLSTGSADSLVAGSDVFRAGGGLNRECEQGQKYMAQLLSIHFGIPELFGTEQKAIGNADVVLNAVGGCAQEQVGDELVAVRAHRHEITAVGVDPFDDFLGGIAVGELGERGDSGGLEFGLDVAEIGFVFPDFFAGGVGAVELGRDAGGDVEEDQLAVHDFCEFFDVVDDGAIGRGRVEGDEDGVVHMSLLIQAGDYLPGLFQ